MTTTILHTEPTDARPEWVKAMFALNGGAEFIESGEHGFWSVQYDKWWITDCDAPEGRLCIGWGDDINGEEADEADVLASMENF